MAIAETTDNLEFLDEDQNAAFDVEYHTPLEYTEKLARYKDCLLYTSPSPRDRQKSRMPSSA